MVTLLGSSFFVLNLLHGQYTLRKEVPLKLILLKHYPQLPCPEPQETIHIFRYPFQNYLPFCAKAYQVTSSFQIFRSKFYACVFRLSREWHTPPVSFSLVSSSWKHQPNRTDHVASRQTAFSVLCTSLSLRSNTLLLRTTFSNVQRDRSNYNFTLFLSLQEINETNKRGQ